MFGGPVWIPKLYHGRDKTFFFFSWEQYRQKQGSTNTSTVPTDQERAGDFSFLLNPANVLGTNPCDGTPIIEGQIFDPRTTTQVKNGVECRTAFPNNQVPISAVAKKYLALFPNQPRRTRICCPTISFLPP